MYFNMDYEEIWQAMLSQIKLEVSTVNYNTWFKNTRMLDYKDSNVSIGVPNQFVKEWLESKYGKDILRILRAIHENIRSVSFSILKQDVVHKKNNVINVINNNTPLPLENLYINRDDNLNPKYVFENYIVGDFNNVAHAAASAIVNNPGLSYNPFFIYGNTGLGKTHLIQSIGNSVKKKYSEKKVFYTSFERFYMDYVGATNSNSINKFKEKYRKFDVFIMDDIQFITNKDKTQDELFHIFNLMYETNKQIIFSSDKHPSLILGLEERLLSRFSQGMVVDVVEPDFESRIALVREKIKELGFELENETISFIAENTRVNIRELEGLIKNIGLQTQIKKQKLSLSEIKNILKNNIKKKKLTSPKEIVKIVADFYNVEEVSIYEKNRRKEIVHARQMIMFILREEYNISYPVIGQELGGKDHTTIIHSYNKVKKDLENNSHLLQELDELKSMLK